MKTQLFEYLKSYSTVPREVDRLILSAFLYKNSIAVHNNLFVKSYIIDCDNETEFKNLNEFTTVLDKEFQIFNIEVLIELFEFVVSPSDKIINGAIYTPSNIRQYIVDQVFLRERYPLDNAKIADIACGCGGFLYTAAKELKFRTGFSYEEIFQNQIFGLDIQEYSVTRSKMLLCILAISEGEDVPEFQFNIHQGDALVFNWRERYGNFEGFQIIIGNPPYVCARNLDEVIKENLQNWSVCASGNPDLYIPFFQIGYENLAPHGVLGFITMNSFFKSLNGRALRSYFTANNVKMQIIDFGTLQIFHSRSTYTCICFLEKVEQPYIEYYKSNNKEFPVRRSLYQRVNYNNLNSKKGWNLNNNAVISRIEAIGKPFGEIYRTRHGIATLKNDLFIFKPVAEDNEFYYLQNGNLFPIEKGICKDILNSNKLSRSIDFDQVKEKILFPYNDAAKPRALEENFLKDVYPRAFEYLTKKKSILANRDKGKGKYEQWFAFGRTQSLEKIGNKLFFPKYSDKVPNYLVSNDNELLFYNGQAIIGHSHDEMLLIKKIMESRIFWYYIKTTSKPYSSNYYSLNGNYIRNFGIPQFSTSDKEYIVNEIDQQSINDFFEYHYNVHFNGDTFV